MLQGFAALVSGCGRRTEQPLPAVQADLVVCTDLEPAVYEPVVKEFEERTGLTVEVQAEHRKRSAGGSRRSRQKEAGMEAVGRLSRKWDLAFGVSTELLDEYKALWLPCESSEIEMLDSRYMSPDHVWTGFWVLPLVIMYNTNVVTYRELPVGWEESAGTPVAGTSGICRSGAVRCVCPGACGSYAKQPEWRRLYGKLAENLNREVLKRWSRETRGSWTGVTLLA